MSSLNLQIEKFGPRNGRPPLGKGHFSSPGPYLIDTICISKLPQYFDKSLLHQKYVIEGLPAKEIARQLACSLTAVKDHLRAFKIRKDQGGRAVHKENLCFGKKLMGHRLDDHKSEIQVIETIKRMYQQEGLGPTAIGRILDAMKVPTKRQGKKWDHSLVTDILEREGIYKQARKSPRKEENNGKVN